MKKYRSYLIYTVLFFILAYLCSGIAVVINYIKLNGLYMEPLSLFLDVLCSPKMHVQYASILTPFFIMLGSLFFFYTVMMTEMNAGKKFMAGKEHGTSEWGSINELNKKFEDPDKEKNRIISEHLRISINDRRTQLNNNQVILGGSGTGKTQFEIAPNLLCGNTAMLFLDPSGEILRDYGNALQEMHYEIRVINTINLALSDAYNPMAYIHSVEDIDKMLTMIIANTTPKGQQSNDPFWEKSERMLVKAIMLYVWKEEPADRRHLVTVIRHMSNIQIVSGKPYYYAGFGVKIHRLSPKHPARVLYERVLGQGPEETLQSIWLTAISRFSMFDGNPELERILSSDAMSLDDFGVGYQGNPDRKIAYFCIIPDNGDKTYSFIIGLFYSQLFDRSYSIGDTYYNNRLPVPVMFWMDELANVTLPEGFTALLATVRKRNIGLSMIFQNISQIKRIFDKDWESIIANADTFIYLGGNDSETQKYISEKFGQMNLYTRSDSHSYGQSESASNQVSALGRSLIFASEIDTMDPDMCLIKIKSQNPVMDHKYRTFESAAYKHAKSLGPYVLNKHFKHTASSADSLSMLSEKSLQHYKTLAAQGGCTMITLHPEALFSFEKDSHDEISAEELKAVSKRCNERLKAQQAIEEAKQRQEETTELTKKDMLRQVMALAPEQAREILLAIEHGLPESDILKIFNPDLSAEQMALIRTMLESQNTPAPVTEGGDKA